MLRWVGGCGFRLLKNSGMQRPASSAAPTIALDKLSEEGNTKAEVSKKPKKGDSTISPESVNSVGNNRKGLRSQLVAAAFASLKSGAFLQRKKFGPSGVIGEAIAAATTPEELLSLTTEPNLSKNHALQIVSILAEWSVQGKADESNYEEDPRFVSLCHRLGSGKAGGSSGFDGGGGGRKDRGGSGSRGDTMQAQPTDLSMVLGVTGEDEAARLVSTISLEQMIKVLSSLAAKKRRSVQLLRSLAYNISSTNLKLNVKQSADILYSLAILNYPDEALLEKVNSDLRDCISECQKTAVIGSIATSLGLLRYKDRDLLDLLCDWVIQNKKLCRSQDITSLLYTLAIVNHVPALDNFIQEVSPLLKEEEFPNALTWLDIVWSLVVLQLANSSHLQSVLNPAFIDRLLNTNFPDGLVSVSCRKKLLNINGSAMWTKGYNGPLLKEDSEVNRLTLVRTKGKQTLVKSVMDSLSSLLPSSNFLKINVDSGMGFLIDGECLLDSNMTPLPLTDKNMGESMTSNSSKKAIRIAVMVWDYHDFTRRERNLTGACQLNQRLVSHSGFRVLSVPYMEFDANLKQTARVLYMEKKLRSILQQPPGG